MKVKLIGQVKKSEELTKESYEDIKKEVYERYQYGSIIATEILKLCERVRLIVEVEARRDFIEKLKLILDKINWLKSSVFNYYCIECNEFFQEGINYHDKHLTICNHDEDLTAGHLAIIIKWLKKKEKECEP